MHWVFDSNFHSQDSVLIPIPRNLMAKDEFRNLGFQDEEPKKGLARLEELRKENEELKKKHGKS